MLIRYNFKFIKLPKIKNSDNIKCSQGCKSRIFIHLFIYFWRGGREGGREGEKHHCVVASPTPPNWGPGPQPTHVP